jgi:hypothetical protein
MRACISGRVFVLGASEVGKTRISSESQVSTAIPHAYQPTWGIHYHPTLYLVVDEYQCDVQLMPQEVGANTPLVLLKPITDDEQGGRNRIQPVQSLAFLLLFDSKRRKTYVIMWTVWWTRAVQWILDAQAVGRRPFLVFVDTATYTASETAAQQTAHANILHDIGAIMPPRSFLFLSAPLNNEMAITTLWNIVAHQIVVQSEAEKRDARRKMIRTASPAGCLWRQLRRCFCCCQTNHTHDD